MTRAAAIGITPTIFHGDWRDGVRSLPDGCVDLVVMDPPYGSTALKWDKAPDMAEVFAELSRVCKPTAVIVCFAAQPFATDVINAGRGMFRYDWIWAKSNPVGFLDAKRRPLRDHELILVFIPRMKGSIYNPQMTEGKPYRASSINKPVHYRGGGGPPTKGKIDNPGTRYPRSVQFACNKQRPALHPTQKPVTLCEMLVKTYSHPGGLVLDPFAGSGTTVVAAATCGRRAVGVEREPR